MSQLDPPTPKSDRPKPLGEYLVEAKLLTPAHIEVALYDQRERGYRLGDILALRGWVKEEIIEWIVQNKLLPERQVQEEDFDTLLISLKEVLEQKESEDRGLPEAEILEEPIGSPPQDSINEREELPNPVEPASQLPPPPPPRERKKETSKPVLFDLCERETLIIDMTEVD